MFFDALTAAVSPDGALPKSKNEMFTRAAGAVQLASLKGKKRLLVESIEYSNLPLNKLNDGSRGSQDILDRFNGELGVKVAGAIGATVVGSKSQLAKLKRGQGKQALFSDLSSVSGSLVVLAPASARDWKAIASDSRKDAIVILNGVRNTAPTDRSMAEFAYAFYLRRLTYGYLFSSGFGAPWKAFASFREAAPKFATDYGSSPPPIEKFIIKVSADLQERAGFMKMGG